MTETCSGKLGGTAECRGTRSSVLLRWALGACLSVTMAAAIPVDAHAQSIGFGPVGINLGGIGIRPYQAPRRSNAAKPHDQAKSNSDSDSPKDPNTETLLTDGKDTPAAKDTTSAKATNGKEVVERTSSSEGHASPPPSAAPRTEGRGPDFSPEQ